MNWMHRRYEVLPWIIIFIVAMLVLAFLSWLGWDRWEIPDGA